MPTLSSFLSSSFEGAQGTTGTGAQGLQGISGSQGSSGVSYNKSVTTYVATGGQTTFSAAYSIGFLDVYLNGIRLSSSEYTASNGTSIILAVGASAGDVIDIITYNGGVLGSQGLPGAQGSNGTQGIQGSFGPQGLSGVSYNKSVSTYVATLNQTTFSAAYSIGFLDVYLNGIRLSSSEYTASNGTSIILSSGAAAGDLIDIIAYTGGVLGSQGLPGAQGSLGIQGLDGQYAAIGVQGITGTQGLYGSQGTSGSGSQGTTGSQGTQGLQGTTGSQGLQGISVQGSTGSQGLQGISVQGSTGSQGLQGLQGITVTVSDDTSTNATRYPLFEDLTTGNISSVNVSSSKLTYNPSTGRLTSTSVFDSSGNLRTLPQNAVTSYTLVATDTGKHISVSSGGVTVPYNVLSTGDVVTIYNNSGSNQTITQAASVTLRQSGTANTGNRTLAQYGVATILCVAGGTSSVFVISGSGLS